MQYAIEVQVNPTAKEDTYRVVLFIKGFEDDQSAHVAVLFSESMLNVDPSDDMVAQAWTSAVLENATGAITHRLTGEWGRGKEILMRNVFKERIY